MSGRVLEAGVFHKNIDIYNENLKEKIKIQKAFISHRSGNVRTIWIFHVQGICGLQHNITCLP